MSDITPTPSQRFLVNDIKLSLPRGSDAYRMMDRAQLADGFPHSYPAEFVDVARQALVYIAEKRELTISGIRILRLMDAQLPR